MNINFPPVDAGYIKTKVEGGYYSNATEMVRDAVRRMREQDDHHGRLLAALESVSGTLPRAALFPTHQVCSNR